MRSQEKNAAIAYEAFDAGRHPPGAVELFRSPGWGTHATDPEPTRAALSAPGVTTVVAARGSGVVGFAQMRGDWQAHPPLLAAGENLRKSGIGRRPVGEAFRRSGGERGGPISNSGAEGFSMSLPPPKARPGFRIYPVREEKV